MHAPHDDLVAYHERLAAFARAKLMHAQAHHPPDVCAAWRRAAEYHEQEARDRQAVIQAAKRREGRDAT